MSIQTIIETLVESGIEPNEARKEVQMLLEHFCSFSAKDTILGKSEPDLKIIEEKVAERISKRIPIQYIIGESWFMGEYFKVNSDVLIPRDETEILVKKAIEMINKHGLEDVLDIGTGSGCIACTIAKKTNAVVLGVDISSDALRIALDNVTKLGINNRAVFRKSDLFTNIRPGENFDLIISNPPYIPYGTELSKEVMHEPQLALFAKDNGLEFYKKIIEEAPQYLTGGGYLMFELGIGEAADVKNLMKKHFSAISIEKDLAGIERVIWGELN